MRKVIFAAMLLLILSGCESVRDFHAVEGRIATCDVTEPNQIEAIDDRTGFPLLSTPHRYTCKLKSSPYDWVVENESESSLEDFSDVPSSVIQQAIPKPTIGY